MEMYKVGDTITCITNKPLNGNEVAPPLEEGKDYEVEEIFVDGKGNQHLHVGLKSEVNYVTSIETEETLPDSGVGGKHWCHPSRFKG